MSKKKTESAPPVVHKEFAIVRRYAATFEFTGDRPAVEERIGYFHEGFFYYRDGEQTFWCERDEVFETPEEAVKDWRLGVLETRKEHEKEVKRCQRELEKLGNTPVLSKRTRK